MDANKPFPLKWPPVSTWLNRSENRDALAYVLRFTIVTALLFGFFGTRPDSFYYPLSRSTTQIVGGALALFGPIPRIHDLAIVYNGLAVRVIPECTAIYLVILYIAFIAAYRATPREKVAGMVAGIPVLFAGNILRLVVLIVVGQHFPDYFGWMHAYLSQVFMVGLLIICTVLWLVFLKLNIIHGVRGSFILRFCAFSSLFFLLWVGLQKRYMAVTDGVLKWCFDLFDHPLAFNRGHEIYYQTLNVVILWGLIAATRHSRFMRKVGAGVAGLGILFLLNLVIRFCNVLFSVFDMQGVVMWSNFFHVAGQYMIPFILWSVFLYLERNRGGS